MWDPVGLPLDPLEYTMTEAEAALNYSVLFAINFMMGPLQKVMSLINHSVQFFGTKVKSHDVTTAF